MPETKDKETKKSGPEAHLERLLWGIDQAKRDGKLAVVRILEQMVPWVRAGVTPNTAFMAITGMKNVADRIEEFGADD